MSALTCTFAELYADVADYLGYTRTESAWGVTRSAEVKRYVNEGYRSFLQGLDPRTRRVHPWSFLRPQASMVWWADATGSTPHGLTGTTDGAGNSATAVGTSTDLFHDSMIGHDLTFDVGSYEIHSVTSGYTATVLGDATGETAGCSVSADGRYSLPADFGGLLDPFNYDPDTTPVRIVQRTPAVLHRNRAGMGDETGWPREWAIQARTFAGAYGQRYEVTVNPAPASDYTLYYRYRVNPDAMGTSAEYPYGGPMHANTLRACALAEAELSKNDGQNYWQTRRLEAMQASIDIDTEHKPGNLGYCGDDSDSLAPVWNRRINPVTY